MSLHSVLKNQLQRLQLREDTVPDSQQAWQDFIHLINNAYRDADQERGGNECSMGMSLRELTERNEKLSSAQHIARLGCWDYDKKTGIIALSNELHHLFNPQGEPEKIIRNLEHFMHIFDEKGQKKFSAAMDQAFSQGEDDEMELRTQGMAGECCWCQMILHPLLDADGGRTKLRGIIIDITRYKKAEQEIFELNQQLVDAARKAGKADIATSVLHNIGNVLNSASVSARLAQEKIEDLPFSRIKAIVDLMNEHHKTLKAYLTGDEKGKLVPEYLALLNDQLAAKIDAVNSEIKNVEAHLQHIKKVVAMQQSLSKPARFCEQVRLVDLIDAALKMSGCAEKEKGIILNKDYQLSPTLVTDKTKVIEILVNLFKNAQQALQAGNGEQQHRAMTISVKQSSPDERVSITVSDNGPGVLPANKIKIFSFNFTTKADGHGIGLHASANLAKELGGSLQLEENNPGEGATFSLLLPLKPEQVQGGQA